MITHNNSHAQHFPFVGRASELAKISARLTSGDCRLLTITGMGGSGKTRLAIEAANLVAPQFAQGAVFVELQPLTHSDLLAGAIARALGLVFSGEAEPHDQLLEYVRAQTLLLVLDNFEHLIEGTALLETMLAYAPGVKFLVTSREALNMQAEWLYPLKGLPVPPSVYTASLDEYAAARLFLFHARRVQPGIDQAREHEAIVRICTLAAGMPLAIELAATWLKGLSAGQIARAMQQNLDFLATSLRTIEERHRSMRAVFEQSWKLLSQHEARAFACLSVFHGGFDSDAAEQVAGATLATLAALVEKSLVQRSVAGRFGMHEMLRQYGRQKLAKLGEQAAIEAAHSRYFAEWMRQGEAQLQQAQQIAVAQAIEADFENVRMAWEWSIQQQAGSHLHAMLNTLYLFGFLRGRYREAIAMFQQGLAQATAGEALQGRLLARRWGYLHWLYQATHDEVFADLARAQDIATQADNRFEMAFCHLISAYACISAQRYPEALPHLHTSLALFEAIGAPYYTSWVLHRIGFVYHNFNDSAHSNTYTRRSLELARASHNNVALVICLYNLGSDYILAGDYLTGQQYCEEALHVASQTGHRDQIAYALSLLSLCALSLGDFGASQEYARRSSAIIEDIRSRLFEPYNRALMILLACLHEEYSEGVRLHSLVNYESSNKMGLQIYSWALAALSCGLGHAAEARAAIAQVLHLSDLRAHQAISTWLAPCAAYVLAETEPEIAVQLLAWARTAPAPGLYWARAWPLTSQLEANLQAIIASDTYANMWRKGAALPAETIIGHLWHASGADPAMPAEAPYLPILTSREREILDLMAAGLTNPQIAARLVIGAGTVKTHTLNIYRKLEVANRTQAIVRARALGLLGA